MLITSTPRILKMHRDDPCKLKEVSYNNCTVDSAHSYVYGFGSHRLIFHGGLLTDL